MHMAKSRYCFALAAAFGFATSDAQAEWISPASIPSPPTAVASVGGTPVPPANWVTTQYTGLGLNFSLAAITHLDGVKVWAPLEGFAVPASGVVGGPVPGYQLPEIFYGPWQGGGLFVVPGTLKPTSVYSTILEIVGGPVTVEGFNSRWQEIASAGPDGVGPHGGQLYTLSGGGIHAFGVFVPVMDPPDTNYPDWGIAAVSFANNPEPSSLVLAGLGALGLAARFGWRRSRGAIA